MVAVREMAAAGCEVFVVLGGDGTSRAVASVLPDAILVPVATGTNNVFPQQVEATAAGLAAGYTAAARLPPPPRCKRVEIHRPDGGFVDLALVDAVLLRNDFLGNHMPFDTDRIAAMVLALAEASAVGTSPIGGYVCPVGAAEAGGVALWTCPDAPAEQRRRVPISPGLFGDVGILRHRRLADGEAVRFEEAGILALDGDRLYKVSAAEPFDLRVCRSGPRLVDVRAALAAAAAEGWLGRR